jgi:hypothetical protein
MARGRMYTAVFEAVSVSAVQDLFEINAPSSAIIFLHEVTLGQSNSVTSQELKWKIHRASTSGSGGSTPTAGPTLPGDAAFTGTVKCNSTTQGTAGTVLKADTFNVLSGLQWTPTPECQFLIPPSGRLTVSLDTAPSGALTMSGTIQFEVIG